MRRRALKSSSTGTDASAKIPAKQLRGQLPIFSFAKSPTRKKKRKMTARNEDDEDDDQTDDGYSE